MILKAVKILPYLLPTTANVTMGVLNRPNRATITPRNITLETNNPTAGRFIRGYGETYTQYRSYTYYNTSNIGTFSGQSVSTTEVNDDSETNAAIWWGTEAYDGTQINLNPKNVTLIKYHVAWASLYITLNNLMIDIGITLQQTFSDPLLAINTKIGLMEPTIELDNIIESNWTLTKDTMNDVYNTVENSLQKNTAIYRLSGRADHVNDDDILWDGYPNGTYPNIDQQIYLKAGETYYIGIVTEIEWKNRAYTEMEQIYWTTYQTMLTNTELEVTVGGQSVVNYPLYEVVDIPGLMFTVLTMPFSFISQAFNITLFPNTIYSVNISGIFLSIIALLVFAWIIKLVLRTLK